MYIERLLESKLRQLAQRFKAVLITGARQVGKSTLLSHCFPELKHITFDALTDDYGARQDPILFLNNFSAPIILDEIQYCPDLLSPMKRYIDQSDRVAIIQLDNLTIAELARAPQNFLMDYIQDPVGFIKNFTGLLPLNYTLYEMIWRGGMPGILNLENEYLADYFSSYIKTYIERDVRLLENIQDLNDFERFVRLSAALAAQEINYSELGREIGIVRSTAMRWLGTLKHTCQWQELTPYHGNTIKRLSKKSKGYFHDTGIACYLQRISSPESLASHPGLSALFENFIGMNIIKLANVIPTQPYVYHWRTSAGAEVDIVLERDGALFPIEIKCKSQLTQRDTRGLKAFYDTYPHQNIMPGMVIYAGNTCYQLSDNIVAVPWNAMFK